MIENQRLRFFLLFLLSFCNKSHAQQDFFNGKLTYETIINQDTIISFVYLRGDSVRVDFGFKDLPYSHGLYFITAEKSMFYSLRSKRFINDESAFIEERSNYAAYAVEHCVDPKQGNCLHYKLETYPFPELVKTETGTITLSPTIQIPYSKKHIIDPYALNGSGFCTEKGEIKVFLDGKVIRKKIRLIAVNYETPDKTLFATE